MKKPRWFYWATRILQTSTILLHKLRRTRNHHRSQYNNPIRRHTDVWPNRKPPQASYPQKTNKGPRRKNNHKPWSYTNFTLTDNPTSERNKRKTKNTPNLLHARFSRRTTQHNKHIASTLNSQKRTKTNQQISKPSAGSMLNIIMQTQKKIHNTKLPDDRKKKNWSTPKKQLNSR